MNQNAKKTAFPSKFFIVLAVLAAGGIAAGVIVGIMAAGGDGGSKEIKLPDYAYLPTAPRGAAQAYQFAVDSPEYLAAVPCYCGCGQLEGHTSNLDCFIKSREGDKVEFDDHASY